LPGPVCLPRSTHNGSSPRERRRQSSLCMRAIRDVGVNPTRCTPSTKWWRGAALGSSNSANADDDVGQALESHAKGAPAVQRKATRAKPPASAQRNANDHVPTRSGSHRASLLLLVLINTRNVASHFAHAVLPYAKRARRTGDSGRAPTHDVDVARHRGLAVKIPVEAAEGITHGCDSAWRRCGNSEGARSAPTCAK